MGDITISFQPSSFEANSFAKEVDKMSDDKLKEELGKDNLPAWKKAELLDEMIERAKKKEQAEAAQNGGSPPPGGASEIDDERLKELLKKLKEGKLEGPERDELRGMLVQAGMDTKDVDNLVPPESDIK